MNVLGRNLRCIACATSRSPLVYTIPSLHLGCENGLHSDGRRLAKSWQRSWRTRRGQKARSLHLSIQRPWLLFCSLFSMDWHCKRFSTRRSILVLRITCLRTCCIVCSLPMNESSFLTKNRFFVPSGASFSLSIRDEAQMMQ